MSITPTEAEVAAFAQVALHNAESSHTAGYKVTFRLLDETEYEQFSGITKRKKGKAGGRYRVFLLAVDERLCRKIEALFIGWTMSNTAGGRIKFELVSPEDFQFFRDLPPGSEWSATLVELDDEDKPVDQEQRERAETIKGGPKSQRAGAMCADASFQRFVGGLSGAKRANPDQCAQFIRDRCRIKSRAELDHDPAAWERFTRWVSKPFAIWSNQ